VFQSGDGPKITRSTTDADGRFRVPGVPNAPAFLFVSKAGYHFLGRPVDAKATAVEFRLRRLDEPPSAPLKLVASPVTRDEERAIARALVAEVQNAPGTASEVPDRQQIPEITALTDPDRAIAMIENQVLSAEPGVVTALAVARFEQDPRQALELLDAIDQPNTAWVAALSLFDRLGTTASPEFRRELLERAARRPPIGEHPGWAASQLARVADRWLDLGNTGRGAVLVRKAKALAEKPRPHPFFDPRDDLALALARVDLPAALKLLEGRQPGTFSPEVIRTGIAHRLATVNPAEARRIIGLLPEHSQPSVRSTVCLRMAARDLPAARALAAEDHDPMVEALVPAVAAQARAKSDPDGAKALLREAVERIAKVEDGPPIRPAPAVALARLLPLAARIDPDRAPDLLWLALSHRPPPDVPASPGLMFQARRQLLDWAELAAWVARYDRSAAEAVFASVADRLPELIEETQGLGGEGPAIFRAAGAFDARAARRLLDALPEDPEPPPPGPPRGQPSGWPNFRHHSKAQARIALARTIALPPSLRHRHSFLTYVDDEFISFED
jgi:hypothetical protein